MELPELFQSGTRQFLPLLVALAAVGAVLAASRFALGRREREDIRGARFQTQVVMASLTLAGVVVVIMALPISENLRGQLISFLGILLSAAIALASTTFLGNAMAGILLRVVRSFRMGDFILVGDCFGRASDRGLFHTEIQTQNRNLVTLPNLHLVTQPVKVIRSSGTLVSATVSLGYDIEHNRVAEVLKEAARSVELEQPFVRILELGDFSVSYRVSGLLTDVKRLLSMRSRLRASMLSELHAAGIEIVSPHFMAARVLAEGSQLMPETEGRSPVPTPARGLNAVLFDKAEAAERVESLQAKRLALSERLTELGKELAAAATDAEREPIERRITAAKTASDRISEVIREREEQGWD